MANQQPVVIVTGASRGMGAAAARWLGKAGAAVVATARDQQSLADVADDVAARGGDPLPLPADVSDPESCVRIVKEALGRFGRLDGLINNAGVLEPVARAAAADRDAWRYNIEVNLMGPYYMTAAALEPLREARGRIVNVSSGAAVNAVAGWSAYCAAKAGMTHFTRVLAVEEPDVTAISLRPGVVDTQMQGVIREKGPGNMDPDKTDYFQNLKAEGKLEPPEVPGRSMAWLALRAPREWSGRFVEYDDPGILDPARAMLGESLR